MNVCIAIEKYDPVYGGAERYCWDFSHYLAARGIGVEVICMRSKPPLDASIRVSTVRPLRFPQALRHLSFAVLHCLKARKMPGHVHLCLGNTFFMDVYQPRGGIHRSWLEAENRRYPRGVRAATSILQRFQPKNLVQEMMEWWIFRVTRPEVIAISEMIRADIQRFYHYPEGRLHLIPNAVDTRRFSPENARFRDEVRVRYGLDSREFVFVFIANNPRLKGFDVMMRACQRMEGQPFKVLVIGDEARWAGKRAEKRGLGSRFVFGGRADDIEKVLPACDCLMHPAYYDACSRVVLEALASGIPVITTETNGASMYVDESNGLVVPPDDPLALSKAMGAILEAGPVREKGRHFTGEDHERVFQRLVELLEEVQARKFSRPWGGAGCPGS
ncbi:MAG: glycosyltransferase family 4 protein [Desulfomonilia bacterium]|jgi:UDP-glucose:(heptosyl)LPS alpha-1,3-glucosyltransferase